MALEYNKILVMGATSGIGEAYAERIVNDGKEIIITGRRKENLDAFVKKHGSDKVSSVVFDITKLDDIPKFADDVIRANPDLDCVLLNSGIQRGFDFSKPETVDLSAIGLEFTTNYLSYLHLTKAFLPHLQKQNNETSLIFVSSGLALIPMPRCPNYCATKAALHHFVLSLREQMKNGPGNVKIIEIFPPAVQTELHDSKHQPDIKNGRSIGMPLEDFLQESWQKLANGDEQVPVGFANNAFDEFENKRQESFHRFVKQLQKQAESKS